MATLSTVACVNQQRAIDTRTSIVACVSRFLRFNSSRMGQTCHNIVISGSFCKMEYIDLVYSN
jgi:hypothetical protein